MYNNLEKYFILTIPHGALLKKLIEKVSDEAAPAVIV